jgi:uncharacterized membrane protein
MKAKQLLISALASAALLAAVQASAADPKAPAEKCYGVAKAGKNDCQTSKNACSGQVKQDRVPDAWIFLPKGTCERIYGGSLAAKKG